MDMYKRLVKNKGLMDSAIPENEVTTFLSTGVIPINLLFSGKVTGGIPIGKVSQMAAPSSLGKSFVGNSTLKEAQKIGLFTVVIDTESAFDFGWARKIGIDTRKEKLLVIQENQIELVQKLVLDILDGLTREEKKEIFFLIDSFGGLVTSKTVGDAAIGKDVMDMTEAKKKNKFSKILMGTGSTYFIVNHVYDNIGGFGDPLSIPGGRGLFFASSGIVLGSSKAKEKQGDQISGIIVTAKSHKSRFGKENSKLKFRIKHNGGLDVFYGILPDAIEHGCVTIPTKGYYSRSFIEGDKKHREKEIYTADFWLSVFKETDFKKFLEAKYSFEGRDLDVASNDFLQEI